MHTRAASLRILLTILGTSTACSPLANKIENIDSGASLAYQTKYMYDSPKCPFSWGNGMGIRPQPMHSSLGPTSPRSTHQFWTSSCGLWGEACSSCIRRKLLQCSAIPVVNILWFNCMHLVRQAAPRDAAQVIAASCYDNVNDNPHRRPPPHR